MKTVARVWLTALLLCPLPALAAPPHVPPILQNFLHAGMHVLRGFDAPAGLTGYVVEAHGRHGIVYVTADKQHMLIGTLLNAQGDNLTASEAKQYFPKPNLNAVWKQLAQSHWIAEGAKHPKTIIYEFTDPNCPFCHLYWLANRHYFHAGLQVRHILVGFLTPSSKRKAAAILESANPAAAYRRNEAQYRSGVAESQAGGIAPAQHPQQKTLREIDANTALMNRLGVNGTPGVFYKDKAGNVRRVVGLPQLSKLPQMYGLPVQKLTDPALQPYL